MISWWALLLLALGYVSILFAIAYWGDKADPKHFSGPVRTAIYGLTLAVYCTSWTFYGAVGSATENGWGYLPIYLGPMMVILFGWGMIHRIVKISKRQNLTSIADFIAARYGKARSLAVLVTVIATVGSIPYIALQLKAVVAGFDIVSNYSTAGAAENDTAFVFAAALAVFAILFGTRKIDVTEHHDGMMLAIAFESVVKLLAFIAVGMFAWMLLGNLEAVTPLAAERAATVFHFNHLPDTFITQLILASAAIFCLPRQFHVAVVEAYEDANIRPTRWTFPLYLLIFSAFIIPITLAGLKALPPGEFNGDAFVLALPMQGEHTLLTVLAFLGGFSAATGMVIVASVALSTMISNEIVMPALMSIKMLGLAERKDYTRIMLYARRGAIIGIAALAYLYLLATDRSAALASIGLLSFAAAAQFMPLILFGLYWPRSTRIGAIAGLSTGFVLWAYTLFLPTLARAGAFSDAFITDGLFSQPWLRPESLLIDLQSNPLTHGVAWSLGANLLVNVAVSMVTRQSVVEKIQARTFAGPAIGVGPTRAAAARHDITNADLRSLADRFLGNQNVERSFSDLAASTDIDLTSSGPADRRLLQFTERLIAGAIGASSARVVMTAALRKTGTEIGDVVLLLDETSQALTFNRRLLDATLDNITQGVSVVDSSQRLIGWNSRYEELMNYPPGMVHVGESVADLIRYNGEQGRFGDVDIEQEIAKRLKHLRSGNAYRYQSTFVRGKVIEISGQPMPGGGYVTTYTDITESKVVENELVEAKALLEQRVADRTAELERTMTALQHAKAEAEDANASKTRFLAAAAHDLLQPLNAAKLFAALLNEHRGDMRDEQSGLVERIESSLIAVEDLLGALLDISRLDTAAPEPKMEVLPVSDVFTAIETQFSAAFSEQGLQLRIAKSSLFVRSDSALLRRIVQNFVSNARRYTPSGGVLIGCRPRGDKVAIQVIDTGVGIAPEDQQVVFDEFKRLGKRSKGTKRGLGLGLAIVNRIARLLDHDIAMRSSIDQGSTFEVIVPLADAADFVPARKRSADKLPVSSLQGTTILCVDNEHTILEGMHGLLSKWGAEALTANNSETALEQLKGMQSNGGHYPSILVVDYHLDDDVTGVEVIRELREFADKRIPAIVVTADHAEPVRREVRESGDALLHKPIKPAALRALMSRILSRP
ncbi:MAG: NahK/ErcS family hybrid sensor histidine kinase/response regulator [Woeseiaceae bacterium]